MKPLTIQEQIDACFKHAARNNDQITGMHIYPHYDANHQVIVNVNNTGRYFSVAVLINIKNREFITCNESTWN